MEICLIVTNTTYKPVSVKDDSSRWMAECVHCEVLLIEWPGILFKNLKMNNWKTIKEVTTICKFQGCQLAQEVGLELHETQLWEFPCFSHRRAQDRRFLCISLGA